MVRVVRIEGDGDPIISATPGTTVPVFDDEGGVDCIGATVPVHVATVGFVFDQVERPQFVCLGDDGRGGGGGDLFVLRDDGVSVDISVFQGIRIVFKGHSIHRTRLDAIPSRVEDAEVQVRSRTFSHRSFMTDDLTLMNWVTYRHVVATHVHVGGIVTTRVKNSHVVLIVGVVVVVVTHCHDRTVCDRSHRIAVAVRAIVVRSVQIHTVVGANDVITTWITVVVPSSPSDDLNALLIGRMEVERHLGLGDRNDTEHHVDDQHHETDEPFHELPHLLMND